MNDLNQISEEKVGIVSRIVYESCCTLNQCLPESQAYILPNSLQKLLPILVKLTQRIAQSIQGYQCHLQQQQQTLRKHVKNQIQLKLYYQHLEEVIAGLKKQRESNREAYEHLKSELSGLKEREKYYLTLSNNQTKNDDLMSGLESKLDTITKIKNRLSLNDTGEYYTRNLAKKMERERETRDLHFKKEDLANTLQKLYDNPTVNPEPSRKSRDSCQSKSRKSLHNSQSGRSLASSNGQQNQKEVKAKKKQLDKSKSKPVSRKCNENGASSGHSSVAHSRRNSKNLN